MVSGPTVQAQVNLAKISSKLFDVYNDFEYLYILQQALVLIQMTLQQLMNLIFTFSFKSFYMLKHIQNHYQFNHWTLMIYLLSMTRLQYILLLWPHFILQVIYLE